MRLDHRAELQQIDEEPFEGGGQATKLATNADVVDKPVRVKFATQPSDPELRAYRAEVVETFSTAFIRFRADGHETAALKRAGRAYRNSRPTSAWRVG